MYMKTAFGMQICTQCSIRAEQGSRFVKVSGACPAEEQRKTRTAAQRRAGSRNVGDGQLSADTNTSSSNLAVKLPATVLLSRRYPSTTLK